MNRIVKFIAVLSMVTIVGGVIAGIVDRIEQNTRERQAEVDGRSFHKSYGIYEKYFKRPLDFILSAWALIALSPVMLLTAILVRVKLGSPVLFSQKRPGKDGKVFTLWKFRSMTSECGEDGELLSDEERLTRFGKALRGSSVDELPELFNILKGDMSVVGPRPLLVRDMVFMTDEHRRRHTVRTGLTGLAQIHGRNSITWDEKLSWDLKYIDKISFIGDLNILFKTVVKVFGRNENREELDVTLDYGDALLLSGKVDKSEYDALQAYAKSLIEEAE